MIFFLNILIFLISKPSFAAIQPLTGSSLINQIQSGAVLSQMGFQIQAIPTNWILKKPFNQDSSTIEIGSEELNKKSSLSFHTEIIPVKTDLEKYVRQYLRDYNQYGFEVIGLQSLKTGQNSVVVDLNQKNKSTRSRQVFYKKDNKIVLATCIDEFEQFSKTILICNAVLNTFQWR
ncbi:MAG: hypothetical protein WA160_01415 [Pseudobdellovibrio sp.]